ncbi:hypothetical protein [Agaribacter flavus]|uniref:Uncharacterized protein n=1 Tax=Agaribacter flavus TaxID=1902781 RepID=A0ABV7FPX5_9ALTE
MQLVFKPFNFDAHAHALYELLLARKHLISHTNTVTLDEHLAFCTQHPYREWLVVFDNDELIGSVYLSHTNHIGINLNADTECHYNAVIDYILANFKPSPAQASVVPAEFVINVPPTNKALENTLISRTAHLIQKTYKL